MEVEVGIDYFDTTVFKYKRLSELEQLDDDFWLAGWSDELLRRCKAASCFNFVAELESSVWLW